MWHNLKMQTNARYHPQSGFTLVEILLGLLMFGIISSAIFAAFAAISDGVEHGRQSADFFHVGRAAMQRLVQELNSFYFLNQTNCGAEAQDAEYICAQITGEADTTDGKRRDRIGFLTVPTQRFPDEAARGELCYVCYYIENNRQGRSALFRYEDCTLEDGDDKLCEWDNEGDYKPLELTEAVVGMAFTYTDTDGDEHQDWPPTLSPEGVLPCRVHIALTLQRTPKDERQLTTVVAPLRAVDHNDADKCDPDS